MATSRFDYPIEPMTLANTFGQITKLTTTPLRSAAHKPRLIALLKIRDQGDVAIERERVALR